MKVPITNIIKWNWLAILFLTNQVTLAQKFKTDQGQVSFFSEATIENIEASNAKVSALLNTSNGEVAFLIRISEFEFDKSLMREHFNEKYMESEKFPNATFSGTISGYHPERNGPQPAVATGLLTIHGETQSISALGTVESNENGVRLVSSFPVRLEDYKIKIPKLLWQNIAEEVEVKIDVLLRP